MAGQDVIKNKYKYYFTVNRDYRWKADVPTGVLRERVTGDYHFIGSPKEFLIPYKVRTDGDSIAVGKGRREI